MPVHICSRKCSTAIAFRLTQDVVAMGEHFAVDKQVTRADLHRWNYHNGAATCMGRAAVRAPGEREHGVGKKIISILQAPWNIFFIECSDKKPGYSHSVVVFVVVVVFPHSSIYNAVTSHYIRTWK